MGLLSLTTNRKVFSIFKKYENHIEKKSWRSIKVLRSDRGIEYNFNEFSKLCEDEGVHHQLKIGHALEQNGVVTGKNGTVVKIAWSILKEKGFPNTLRAEAIYIEAYLLNRCGQKAFSEVFQSVRLDILRRCPY